MNWQTLYKSLFAILRIENKIANVVGTGFVINTSPIYILTCNHVVGEGSENNNVSATYSITKRTDNIKAFDLTKVQISYLKVKKIFSKPELDLAILEIDTSVNKDIAKQLGLPNVKSLKLDFKSQPRIIGSHVEWMSIGTLGDLTLTPRFFRGNLVTSYKINYKYKFINPQRIEQEQIIKDAMILEIDQLFIPGSSGSPVINSRSESVIAYVHGFKSWPIMTNSTLEQPAQIKENLNVRNVNIKSKTTLVTSLSIAIDVRSIQKYLIENQFIQK